MSFVNKETQKHGNLCRRAYVKSPIRPFLKQLTGDIGDGGVATLLDEGIYHCSIRTMYRILDDHGEVRERRNQLRHPVYSKPELLAEGPNQVWKLLEKLCG